MQKKIIIPKGFDKEVIQEIGWTPALKVGSEVIISAISGVTQPSRHIFSSGETISDQAEIILEHLTDIMQQAGGSIDDIVEITVFVRPVVSDEDMKIAGKIISQAFCKPAPAESWLVSDFAGMPNELLQVKARGILQ